MTEVEEKTARLVRLAEAHGLGGIIIASQPGFSWLTGGRSNRIDGSRENGSGALFVRADGQRYVIANAIEMPRLLGEELAGTDWEPMDYPWVQDHARPDIVAMLASRTRPGETAGPLGADMPLPGTQPLDREIAAARVPLTPDEMGRYRALGADAGAAVGAVARTLQPGLAETEIARRLADAAVSIGGRATVVLVAADDRIARFRHPVPTTACWRRTVMLVACIQRGGLVVALTRFVSAGRPDGELGRRTVACARVFGRLLEATRPGAKARDIFAAAEHAYADEGFTGEELRHHQGGAIGYRSREWVAHPMSDEIAHDSQAFAWNPSITGAKAEDTVLVSGGTIDIITPTPGWPSIPLDVHGRTLRAAGIFVVE